jgi:hypothetical protein
MVVDCNEYSVNEYSIKVKLRDAGTANDDPRNGDYGRSKIDSVKVLVVAEGTDGKLYGVQQDVDVALGGCEG